MMIHCDVETFWRLGLVALMAACLISRPLITRGRFEGIA